MPQGVLPFQYQRETVGKGVTALSGLGIYLDFLYGGGIPGKADEAIGLRRGQGYSDGQMVVALLLLNLAGGEAVQSLETLEQDEGLMVLLRRAEQWGKGHRRAGAPDAGVGRWRRERQRTLPSPSSVFRYLEGFVGEDEGQRGMGEAFIPKVSGRLQGLRMVNRHLVAQVQRLRSQRRATLDMDATLVETGKGEALWSYQGTRAYQPIQTYWAEQDLLIHTEFRDGNVPAGYEQLRVLQESLDLLPEGVDEVLMRSDTAGYQQELLQYCAEGKHEGYGVIGFAVGADMTPALKEAVREAAEEAWQPLKKETPWGWQETYQEWAEVNFVPDWIGRKKSSPEYRYLAVREPVRQGVLPGLEEQLSFPALVLGQGQVYKVTAIITNRDLPGSQLIRWYRQRCGKSEEVHRILKDDLAGGTLPSGSFGENAAWWAITSLAFNVHTAVKSLALGGSWLTKRLKTIRFSLISVPGRVVQHGRGLWLRVSQGHPAFPLLIQGRQRLRALLGLPAG